jgi:hypothetical protein
MGCYERASNRAWKGLASPAAVCKGDRRFDAPGAKFRRVWNFACVMPLQTLFQILRKTCVKAFWQLNCLQYANVEKIHGWLAEP